MALTGLLSDYKVILPFIMVGEVKSWNYGYCKVTSEELRQKAVSMDINTGDCAHGGIIQKLQQLQITTPKLNRMFWLQPELEYVSDKSEYFFFTGCLPYLDPIFKANGLMLIEIAQDGLRILNKISIIPVVSNDERFCGHDFLWTDRVKEFKLLAKHNLELIKASVQER